LSAQIGELLAIMARLRAADGCPWDRQQTSASIAPFTIEEAYEVADAIGRADMQHLKDELGDLLFQVVFHSQIASETNQFDFAGVVESICDKLRRRHPHVFGDAGKLSIEQQISPGKTSRQPNAAQRMHPPCMACLTRCLR